MKNLTIAFTLTLALMLNLGQLSAYGQSGMPVIYISSKSAVHLRSPEQVNYVDLPSSITGDLPLKNLLRVRTKEIAAENRDLGVLSVTGEHFLAQYRIMYLSDESSITSTEIEILPSHMVPLIPAQPFLSMPQIRSKALDVISARIKKPILCESNQAVTISVNQILCSGELIFLDLSFANSSALHYQIQELSFVIEDKKIAKATNFQQIRLEPKYTLNPLESFSKKARNVYVLNRATFSSSKQLLISLSEKQPSSRTVSLALNYGDILSADSF